MAGCITADYKDIIMNMIDEEKSKEILLAVVDSIPLCEVAPAAVAKEKVRRTPEPWGIEPVYVDAKGKKTTYSSPSALVKDLGLKMSGIQCDAEGQACKAMSVVEILRINGYTVTGNGEEPKKAGEGGKKMTVYHPKSVPEA